MRIYTEADVEKAVKVLWFEGAGWAERGDVENCRIRTAFTNDEGQRFYLELSGMEVTYKSPERFKKYRNAGFVDYCYQLGKDDEKIRFDIESKEYEYSMEGILDFVNHHLNCSFDAIRVADVFYGYFVHKDGGGYNFMEDHTFDEAHAGAARRAFHKIDMEIRQKMGEKYSKISLADVGKQSITVRCYASYGAMVKAGLDPDRRFITVKI